MPLGFLGASDGECGAGDSCAIVVAIEDVGGSRKRKLINPAVHMKGTAVHK